MNVDEHRSRLPVLAVVAACLFAGCSPSGGTDGGDDIGNGSTEPLPLSGITTWAYQIQQISEPGEIDALVASSYDLLVIEPTRTDWSSDPTRNFDTPAAVERLENALAGDGVHRKLVIAYINIGQAEDWRWYWTWSQDWPTGQAEPPDDWPDYVLARDPDGWAGDYPVAYWHDAWKDVVIYGTVSGGAYASLIDEALDSGFDGVYLDWVEGFENEAVIAAAQAAGLDPAQEMVAFIGEMRDYARARDPDFLIIQQNGVALIDDHPELPEIIDAIAQEAVWFGGDATDDWDDPDGYDDVHEASLSDEYTEYLARFLQAGVVVFNCEYALEQADEAYTRGAARGYVTYVSRTPLSRLSTTPPPGM